MSETMKYEQISTSVLKNNLIAPESTEEDNENLSNNKQLQSQIISKSNNFRTIERSNNLTRADEKIDRVKKLSKKLSKLQIQESERPLKLSKFKTRFEAVEENLIFSYETLKSKYNTLRDHTAIMKKKLEEQTENKEDFKRSVTDKLKNFQNRSKNMILEEKDNFKSYCDLVCMKLEAELIKCETELKRDDDTLLKNINDIKEYIRVSQKILFEN